MIPPTPSTTVFIPLSTSRINSHTHLVNGILTTSPSSKMTTADIMQAIKGIYHLLKALLALATR